MNGGNDTAPKEITMDQSRLIAEFSSRWMALGGRVYTAEGISEVSLALSQAWADLVPFSSRASGRIIYWTAPDLDALDWGTLAHEWGVSEALRWDGTSAMRDATAASVLGITGCAWAVAATGSVALYSTPETGLLPSVLAPSHVILIPRDQVVATVGDGLARLKGQQLPPLMKLITGPSMTADIEGTLVTGVHGPGYIGAVLYSL